MADAINKTGCVGLYANRIRYGEVEWWANHIFTASDREQTWVDTVAFFMGHSEHTTFRNSGSHGQPAPC